MSCFMVNRRWASLRNEEKIWKSLCYKRLYFVKVQDCTPEQLFTESCWISYHLFANKLIEHTPQTFKDLFRVLMLYKEFPCQLNNNVPVYTSTNSTVQRDWNLQQRCTIPMNERVKLFPVSHYNDNYQCFIMSVAVMDCSIFIFFDEYG